jgi:2,4-diaminopentanoate dehydrogenase
MGDGATQGLRVVQWATGNIGSRSLRGVIEHPDMTLVGLYVHSPEKAGRDAGELSGLGSTGVLATRDLEAIVGLDADCVLYMPQQCNVDEVCRLLESGANVVTTRGEFHHPASMDAATRERVESACRRGGTSIHSTGSSPGFISEAVPLVLASIQRQLDRMVIEEFADLSKRNSPELLFTLMGFGTDPDAFNRGRWEHGAGSFGPSLRLVAEALGLPLDSVESSGDVATARETTTIAAGTIEAGTVAAQRLQVDGLRHGRPLLSFVANWYCTADLEQEWDLRPTGWRLRVAGDAPLDVEMRLDVPLERMGAMSPGYTANRAINAVAIVCAAAPGIRTSVDLPQIFGTLRDGVASPSSG